MAKSLYQSVLQNADMEGTINTLKIVEGWYSALEDMAEQSSEE